MTSPDPAAADGGAVRPLRADARRNRARILQAARAAFAARGVAVPLDDIARRAGVGPGTLHRHFPTKERLFEAVVRDEVERSTTRARSLIDADDPGAALLGFLAGMADEVRRSRALADALTGSGHMPAVPAAGELHAALGELLVRAQRAGRLRRDIRPGDLTALLVGVCVAAERSGPGGEALPRLMAVVSDGLRAR